MGARSNLRAWRERRANRRKRLTRRAARVEETTQKLSLARERRLKAGKERPRTDEEREQRADRIEALDARIEHLSELLADQRARRRMARRKWRFAKRRVRHWANRVKLSEEYASPHIRWTEGYCRDGTPLPSASREHFAWWCRNVLEPVRAYFGGRTLIITSPYRHKAYNARVGGASDSQHIYDFHPRSTATDIYIEGVSPGAVADYMATLPEVDGLGRYSSFTHGDPRTREGYSEANWSG